MTLLNRWCYGRWDRSALSGRGPGGEPGLGARSDQSGKPAAPSVTVALCVAAEASNHVRVTVWPTRNPAMAVCRSESFAMEFPPIPVIRPQTVTPAPAAGEPGLTPLIQAPVVAWELVQLGKLLPMPGCTCETATPSSAALPIWILGPLPDRISETTCMALLIGIAKPVVDADCVLRFDV